MREIGNTICFATSYNSPPKYPSDGDEFMREMYNFARFVKPICEKVEMNALTKEKDNPSLWDPKTQFLRQLRHHENGSGPANTLAVFMHGYWRELLGVDLNIWQTHVLASRIKEHMVEPINIVLYACGCGGGTKKWKNIHEYRLGSRWDMRGEFGFAMRLAHDLSEIGIHDYRIFAHVGRGHVTERPFCVWITEENGFVKRREIVPYRSWASPDRRGRRQWLRWVKYIQETRNGRFRAPFLTDAELAEVIGE